MSLQQQKSVERTTTCSNCGKLLYVQTQQSHNASCSIYIQITQFWNEMEFNLILGFLCMLYVIGQTEGIIKDK